MTKTEYMKILARSLRRLPKEDYDRAIEYFEEYFAEAGPENEQQAVSEPGRSGKRTDHGSGRPEYQRKTQNRKTRPVHPLDRGARPVRSSDHRPLCPLHTDRSGSPSSLRRDRFVCCGSLGYRVYRFRDPLPLRRDRGTLPLRGRRSVQHRPRALCWRDRDPPCIRIGPPV